MSDFLGALRVEIQSLYDGLCAIPVPAYVVLSILALVLAALIALGG